MGNYQFLSGGGEMGTLVRAKDWSKTVIDVPEKWPQSLRTTLSIILHSKFPMFLWWGPELICFYNDAYRPSLGQNGKHPFILGIPAKEAWMEIWDVIKPLIDQVIAGGEATWSEDQLIPIYRNGNIEDVYWTFSYSPVFDEAGNVAGVLVTCSETTEKIKTVKSLELSNRRYLDNIIQAPVAMCIFRGKNHVVEIANVLMIEIWGKTAEQVMNKPIFEGLPEVKGQGFEPLLDGVFNNGEKFVAYEHPVNLPRNGKVETTYINFTYEALREPDGTVSGVVAIASEVTAQVMARKKIEESEEKLNIVIDASELGTWELDLKTDELIYSARYLEIFGYKNNDALTHEQFLQQIALEDVSVRNKAFKEALEKSVLHYESRLIWEDKSTHWIDVKGKVFYNEEKLPVKLIGTVRDITDQKFYQKELEESEQKFRLLADSMPQYIWTADLEGNLNYFNKSVFDYSGLTPEQIVKDGWIQIVHPDDREENIRTWLYAMASGKDFLFEHRFRRYDGIYRWQLSRAVPQRNADGNIQMWVGTSTDIQEIKELDQQKDLFISMASHELKTPITSIKGYVQLLQSMYQSSEDTFLNKSLKIIDKQIVSLTGLISDLLDLSKIKSGSLFLKKDHFKINELIQEVVEEINHINRGYIITFLNNAETVVYADRERIGQVLINLLTNAVKYSPDSTEIKVNSVVEDSKILVSVEDSGIGISKNEQEKIFERFYRVEGKNEKTFPGFGIGLFISAEIINRHKGNIGVKSEFKKGSVFYFSLPLNS